MSRPLKARDHAIGFVLCAIYVAVLLVSSRNLGMSRDEGFYVVAAERYAEWFRILGEDRARAFETGTIDRIWNYNSEHPSLAKSLFALSYIAQEKWHVFPQQSMAYRFPAMVMAGLLLWLLYIFGARAHSRQAGLFAALAYALLPQPFYHAHLACFDIPITFFLTLVTYAYWRSLESKKWLPILGLTYGLALATKHNAWITPGVFLVHYVFTWVGERRARKRGEPAIVSLIPWWLIAMAIMGPPIFIGSWPWLWHETSERIQGYVAFHTNHVHYNFDYLGTTYFQPPFPMHVAWLSTLFTVPFVTLLLAVIGIVLGARTLVPRRFASMVSRAFADRRHTDLLWLGCAFAPLVVISLPGTPIFGGTKHWYPAFPFMCLFAGVALVEILRRVGEHLPKKPAVTQALTVSSFVLLLAPALVETAHSHPFGLSFYAPIAGGTPGGADLGMNRQFWGFTTGSLVDYFKREMPNGGSVWICDTTWDAWRMLQRDGRLPENIRPAGDIVSADYAIVHHEQHFNEVDYEIWMSYGHVAPDYVLTYDGVPIISVYKRSNARRR